MRSANILGDIVCLHQRTKILLKYVHTNSKYGYLFEILASDTQGQFSISARNTGWFDIILIHLAGGKEEINAAMTQYLSKYLFDKYEETAPQCYILLLITKGNLYAITTVIAQRFSLVINMVRRVLLPFIYCHDWHGRHLPQRWFQKLFLILKLAWKFSCARKSCKSP